MEKIEDGSGGACEDENPPESAHEDVAACGDRANVRTDDPHGAPAPVGSMVSKALPLCTVEEAMERRHSVRSFTDRRIEGPVLAALRDEADACSREGGLRMLVVLDEPRAFSSMLARYGNFRNVRNYVAVIGYPADDLDERAGYYGERLVLAAQALGLSTCWAALTFSKRQVRRLAGPGEKLVCALAIGYGATQGRPRKSKAPVDVGHAAETPPEWFERGVRAALLAPHGHEPAEVPLRAAARRQDGARPGFPWRLHRCRPGHREVPLRGRSRHGKLRLGIGRRGRRAGSARPRRRAFPPRRTC